MAGRARLRDDTRVTSIQCRSAYSGSSARATTPGSSKRITTRRLGRGLPYYLGFGEHILPNAYKILGPLGDKLNTAGGEPVLRTNSGRHGNGRPDDSVGPHFPAESAMAGNMDHRRRLRRHKAAVWGLSNYNAVYFQVEHRFGKGFTFLANYTISKLLQDTGGIDNGQPQGQGEQAHPRPAWHRRCLRLAPSDIAQKFQVNYSVDLPIGRGKKFLGNAPALLDKIVGGWQTGRDHYSAPGSRFRSTPQAAR